MLSREDFASRDAYARQFLEVAKREPQKFKKKIHDVEAGLKHYWPMRTAAEQETLFTDLLYCDICFGASCEDYFMYDFEHLNHEQRDCFVTERKRMQLYHAVNELSSVKLLNHKYETYLRFQDYYQRDILKVSSPTDLVAFIEFISKHPKFIVKPINQYGGKGIRILDMHKHSAADIFAEMISDSAGVVLEELVKQSAEMDAINGSCLNTIRIMTVCFSDHVELYFPLLRCGRDGSEVDNFSSGGLLAAIDVQNGKVVSPFADHMRNFHDKHPNSGIVAKDFCLPQWDDACDMVKKLARLIPENRIVGWDLAHTSQGWSMIEGNGCPQFGGQIFAKDGWSPIFEKVQERLISEMGTPCVWND